MTITSATEGATIYYTLDDTDPSATNGETYSAPFELSETKMVKAIAVKDDNMSEITTKEIEVDLNAVAPVTFNVSGKTWEANTVTMSSLTPDATILYTIDGSDPKSSETAKTYTDPITVTETTTIKAIAKKGENYSDPSEKEVKIDLGAPTLSPAGGTYSEAQKVTMTASHATEVWYTTDGTDPVKNGENSTSYDLTEKPEIDITTATTLKAIAYNGEVVSPIATAEYIITGSVEDVTFNFTDFNSEDLEWAGIDEVPTAGNNDDKGWVVSKFEKDGVIIEFDNSKATKDNGENDPSKSYRLWYYSNKGTNQTQLRLANSGSQRGSTMTFIAPESTKLSSITFNIVANDSKYYFNYKSNEGSLTKGDNGSVWTWNGSTSKVVLTPSTFGGTMWISSIDVTYYESTSPTFNYNTGSYYETFDLTMTTDLPGGKIFYTIDGATPTSASDEYTAPVKIERKASGESTTVKAITVGEKLNSETGKMEPYTSEPTTATYTWAEIDQPEEVFRSIQQFVDWFTIGEAPANLKEIQDTALIKWSYPNLDKVVKTNMTLFVTAVGPNALYLNDGFGTGEMNSIVLTSSSVDFTELYQPNDLLDEGMIIGFEWINDITPSFTLKGNPVRASNGNFIYEPNTMTVDSIIASAAWNGLDIYYIKMNNEWSVKNAPQYNLMVPRIALDNPYMVNELVKLDGLTFTKDITGTETGDNATYTATAPSGKQILVKTELPIGEYAAGKYDLRAIVGYDLLVTPEKVNKKTGEITQQADTTITPFIIPAMIIGEGGDIEKEAFKLTEEVKEGNILIVYDNLAMTALDYNKTYGYAPYKKVSTDDNGEISLSAEDALSLVPAPATSRAEGDLFYIMDNYGRYYYQTGTYNSFNVAYELPENPEEAMWMFEPFTGDDGSSAMKITNYSTGKWIQYSTKYKSYGCYPEEQGKLPVVYQSTGSTTGVTIVEAPAAAAPLRVYSIQGQLLGSSIDSLAPGIYIIRQGNESRKVLVR
ncbi:MAG: chitobiase/beta-hexosaminidase C-terminal domain-containing protein [Pseudoflavonifractor sp.]|nr:chitobiase/beta-hexosaminidase C-terminal domain-containing protein [Alloprevotella sp.]MCM1116677.1 chitobiase/beta-hexosaminidase C-terminal domain-containing protein [Pseudoflavonifractor sp.]